MTEGTIGNPDLQREIWKKLSPELRGAMADVAFGSNGITSELKSTIQDLALEDLTEQKGGKDE